MLIFDDRNSLPDFLIPEFNGRKVQKVKTNERKVLYGNNRDIFCILQLVILFTNRNHLEETSSKFNVHKIFIPQDNFYYNFKTFTMT